MSIQAPIIHYALRLWTANQLLMKGWEIYGPDRLGMKYSPFHGSIPATRVLQNQLDHQLESAIVKTEQRLLMLVQTNLRKSDRHDWIVTFVGIAIILHVMERDAWRLMYWVKHQEQACCFDWLPWHLLMMLRLTYGGILFNRER